jgi:hypothetical protein
MKKILSLLVLIGATNALQASSIFVFDFESLPVGAIAGGSIVLTQGGVSVRFTGPGLQIRDVSGLGVGSDRVLSTSFDAGPITAEFLNGFAASYVDFRNWLPIGGSEVDYVLGKSYDSGSNLLDTEQNANAIFHLSGGAITKVVYVEATTGQGFLLDNFTFEPIPENNGSLALLFLGSLALVIRKRQSAPELEAVE